VFDKERESRLEAAKEKLAQSYMQAEERKGTGIVVFDHAQ
jgi:hypothetical protein